MKNTIKVTIPFSFKGVEYSPSSIIDLDVFSQGDQTLDTVFQIVANENKIDNYSYQYEVLESSRRLYSDPTGIALDFLSNNEFNLQGFKDKLIGDDVFLGLSEIAKKTLGIQNLEDHDDLKAALLKAYKLGRNILPK